MVVGVFYPCSQPLSTGVKKMITYTSAHSAFLDPKGFLETLGPDVPMAYHDA